MIDFGTSVLKHIITPVNRLQSLNKVQMDQLEIYKCIPAPLPKLNNEWSYFALLYMTAYCIGLYRSI